MKKENKAIAKKKKAAQRRRAQFVKKFKTACWIVIPCLVVAAIVGLIVYGEMRAHVNYSAGLTDQGMIKDVNVQECVQLGDYHSLSIEKDKLVNDKMVQESIDDYLTTHTTLNKNSTKIAEKDDKVSIAFEGKVDGEVFEGGVASDYTLTIGSGSLIDDFEDQLIGHTSGDQFTVKVTFPDPYENNEALSGKDAEFDVTFNGFYERPELTDEYVRENFSDYASTEAEYREYLENKIYEENLYKFAQEQVMSASTVLELPRKYLNKLRNIYRAGYEAEYNYYNSLYHAYLGYYMWDNVYDYYNVDKAEFQEMLEEAVEDSAKFYLVMQAVYEQENMTLTDAEVNAFILESDYSASEVDSAIKDYGMGYWRQNAMTDKVLAYLADQVEVR